MNIENQILHGDCLELMQDIKDKSIDMILCDLPYGTTACKWDVIIPFEPLWKQYERIIKDNGAIVLTASQPFTTDLINSNRKLFRYELIWDKKQGANPLLAKKQPMKSHENVLVFYKNKGIYNPQMEERGEARKKGTIRVLSGFLGEGGVVDTRSYNNKYYPKSILNFSNAHKRGLIHPTQKPVALFEYLIKTYTNEGETVLDNCAGSGTTAVACINTNRNYIVMEKEEKYYEIIKKRVNEAINKKGLFKEVA